MNATAWTRSVARSLRCKFRADIVLEQVQSYVREPSAILYFGLRPGIYVKNHNWHTKVNFWMLYPCFNALLNYARLGYPKLKMFKGFVKMLRA